ncbi:hypothetical protein POM88_021711 [Heracleum sosnowskyi]|uniref:Kinesin motor domain-containing protein n=1 Tax=Heracleum sosnowskyi TaxID=360622 RepID=A0AAD8IEE5_9APIA|nr:hypothetical protein POM88_021711 [Heracleum sosnowskyi]
MEALYQHGTYVEGIKEEVVLSPGHALSFIAAGEEHRHVGSNNLNLLSSRSHTIFTLVAKYLVPTIRSIPANGSTKPTCIHLLTGIKAYSKIFWLMDQQDLFTFIFFLLLMSKKMMCI